MAQAQYDGDTSGPRGAVPPTPEPTRARCARDISYHTARSIEELDCAEAAVDREARQAHEHMARLHLDAAARLYGDDLCRIVAERVD